ncbi:hypothetical protein BC828DRAFT_403875 [Blastocladiella britannica]|nr:hypothetical protein BC828DRAFT_403875 [Blastocladiella britannica]
MSTAFFGSTMMDKAISKTIGAMTVVPSVMVTLSVINCIVQGYRGKPIQRAILIASFISLLTDCLSGWAHFMSIIQYSTVPGGASWAWWPQVTAILQGMKNLHGVVSVHLVFLRFSAVVGLDRTWKSRAMMYTTGFAILATATTFSHVYAYASCSWKSSCAHDHAVYRNGYRPLNIVTTCYYAMLAIFTDISFITMSNDLNSISSRLKVVNQFWNIRYYTFYEIMALVLTLLGLGLGIFYGEIGWGPYVEQFLLALIALNATYSVKAVAVLPTDSTGSATGPIKSQFYVPSTLGDGAHGQVGGGGSRSQLGYQSGAAVAPQYSVPMSQQHSSHQQQQQQQQRSLQQPPPPFPDMYIAPNGAPMRSHSKGMLASPTMQSFPRSGSVPSTGHSDVSVNYANHWTAPQGQALPPPPAPPSSSSPAAAPRDQDGRPQFY